MGVKDVYKVYLFQDRCFPWHSKWDQFLFFLTLIWLYTRLFKKKSMQFFTGLFFGELEASPAASKFIFGKNECHRGCPRHLLHHRWVIYSWLFWTDRLVCSNMSRIIPWVLWFTKLRHCRRIVTIIFS